MLAFGWESLLDTARKKGRMPLTCGSHLAETNGAGPTCQREKGKGVAHWVGPRPREKRGRPKSRGESCFLSFYFQTIFKSV